LGCGWLVLGCWRRPGGFTWTCTLTGYRTIPTIGWLFLLQVIAAFALALAVLVTGSRLAAAAGAGFALATLGGYLLSIWFGLFGFKEVRTTAGIVAGVVEVAAFAVLAVLAAVPAAPSAPGQARPPGARAARLQAGIPHAAAAVAGVCVIALVLLGVAVAGGNAAPASAGGAVKAVQIGGARVLADAKGRTLYWFAPDTATKSVCTGSCAGYGPPVTGPLTAPAGVSGTFGTIKRPDGRPGHLQRTSPLHLRRRQRPGPGTWQQPQPQRRPVARSHHFRLTPEGQMQTLLAPAGRSELATNRPRVSRSQIRTFCVPPPSPRPMTSRIRIRRSARRYNSAMAP
jgi:predicted lipoprotein with Yx(FWY)xxD motif